MFEPYMFSLSVVMLFRAYKRNGKIEFNAHSKERKKSYFIYQKCKKMKTGLFLSLFMILGINTIYAQICPECIANNCDNCWTWQNPTGPTNYEQLQNPGEGGGGSGLSFQYDSIITPRSKLISQFCFSLNRGFYIVHDLCFGQDITCFTGTRYQVCQEGFQLNDPYCPRCDT